MKRRKGSRRGDKPRHELTGSKRFDRSCRNHGGCTYCEEGRTFFDRKRRKAADMDLRDYYK